MLPQITPDWSLARLKQEYPGVEMALFAHFGIGSRERSGFAADEKLEELCRRHLIFDLERACGKLNALAAEDVRFAVDAEELSVLGNRGVAVVDARSESEFQRDRIEGSLLLSHQTVQKLARTPDAPVVTVCRDGSQAPAASRILRSQGLNARHLSGGLESWTKTVAPDFPILFPLVEEPGHWYLLADEKTLRFRRNRPREGQSPRLIHREELEDAAEAAELLRALPELELVAVTAETFAVRGLPEELSEVVHALGADLREADLWKRLGRPEQPELDRKKLEAVLAEEAPAILGSHKGTVCVKSYRDRVLTLELGGKCAGCASAQITTQRELASCLYREVPLLDRITSDSSKTL